MDQDTAVSSSHIPWHPAFVQAIQLELEPYRDVLEFQSEYRLTAEPLEIDLVIIRKAPEVVIEKNIGRIFRQVNILEYKSPDDYVSVHDFYKVLGYGYLYAALNRVDMGEMTITIVETRYPRELFRYLEGEGCKVGEVSPGIYRIVGYPVSMQVLESKKLPLQENLWLKGLSNDLKVRDAKIILEESRRRGKGTPVEAYIYALLNANIEAIREVTGMANGTLTLDEVLEQAGLTAKWEQRGEARGEVRGEARGEARGKALGEARGEIRGEKNAWGKVITLLKQGYTVEQLERMSPRGE
jgi:hypothetical protein